MSDAEQNLIRGCIAGERAWQTRLYDFFAPGMMGVCLRYCRNRQEAEEILLEGFLRVFRYIGKFRGEGSLEGWIRRIMIHCALQRYKTQSHLHLVSPLDSHEQESATDPEVYLSLDEKELLNLVQGLPAGYRLVFNLFVFEGYKHREIAELLGISEGTSKSNLSDARAILKKALISKKNLAHCK